MTAQLDELERELKAGFSPTEGRDPWDIARDALRLARSMEADARRYRWLNTSHMDAATGRAAENIINQWYDMTPDKTSAALAAALRGRDGGE